MERYICIPGHFYQPPRENPWLEDVELEDSAYPSHDWNERVAAECYAPTTVSRILDGEGRIVRLPNNYASISFNFGPTLLAWMAAKAPEIYEAILEADRHSQRRFSGHGSALAQVYNHIILPLASPRDKYTQILWGIRDFEHRFGRPPEGLWLPETAVDLETLDMLAELGIRFTILAPHQVARVRPPGQESWHDVNDGRIDPTMAYQVRLPWGRSLALFFYDGPVSQAVAFENLLSRGEDLAARLLGAFSGERPWPQLVHIATDGETYGHHHHHGDMALAYALNSLEAQEGVRLTHYREYLERHPPTWEVEIIENTSWSCSHGVERWWRDCGCSDGGPPHWRQDWRTPLREITLGSLRVRYAVLHFGDHNLCGGVRPFQGEEAYGRLVWEITETFSWADFPETIRRIDRHFGESTYSLRSLFRDEQRKILEQILAVSLAEIWELSSRVFAHQLPLMRFHKELGVPLPRPFQVTAKLILNYQLTRAFQEPRLDLEGIRTLMAEARRLDVPLEGRRLEYAVRRAAERLMRTWCEAPHDLEAGHELLEITRLLPELSFEVNLWRVQNRWYELAATVYPERQTRAQEGDPQARVWTGLFLDLGRELGFSQAALEHLAAEER